MRVVNDPEVILTTAERERYFDMAIEMHELQTRVMTAENSFGQLNHEMTEIEKKIGERENVPAQVKSLFEALNKAMKALAPRVTAPVGGRRGRRRGDSNPSVLARIGQAKNGLMGGMLITQLTMMAYEKSKTEGEKAISDTNALFKKVRDLSPDLAKYDLTLTPPRE